MAEHRVPVLAGLRRYPDPTQSADPRIYTLLSDLRALDLATPAPRSHFRAELRAQLVAVAPRLVAEGVTAELPAVVAERPEAHAAPAPAAPTRSRLAATVARLQTVSLGRPLAIGIAVVAVFAMLLGGAVWISKKALPGDALYSLKRANENVQLSLADGPTAKSKAYLDFAKERADEVSALLKRATAMAAAGPSASGQLSAHTAKLVTSTLSSGDGDVRSAAQLLGQQAVSSHSAAPLQVMMTWAPGQIGRLQTIVGELPAGPVHDRANASLQLVEAALGRAGALSSIAGCSCLNSAASDALGPVPCSPCSAAPLPSGPNLPTGVPLPGSSSARPPTSGTTPQLPGILPGSTTLPVPTLEPGGSTSGSGTSSGSGKPTLPIKLPTLPPIFPSHTPNPSKSATQTCVLNLLGVCVQVGNSGS
jgi:hypothetical protein